jgi:hypothetical protein
MVRAKFSVNAIRRTRYGKYVNGETVQTEMQTIELNPVYSNDENDENKKFWDATPSGKIELGTINLEAAKYFELGKEYYVDFKEAENEDN